MKFCSRCQEAIRDGELYRKYDVDAGSAAAMTVYWHEKCLPGPATTPTRRTRRP
jgi:hypothetical protein